MRIFPDVLTVVGGVVHGIVVIEHVLGYPVGTGNEEGCPIRSRDSYILCTTELSNKIMYTSNEIQMRL